MFENQRDADGLFRKGQAHDRCRCYALPQKQPHTGETNQMSINTLLLVVIVVILLGGGGFYFGR